MSSYSFKVVLLGQGCVGKTSLVLRYVSNVFNDSHQSTLQASFLKKQLYLEQDLVKLNIWDTAGQEKFHALGPIYYREANGALLVYDVTNPDSLRKVRDWVKELNKMLGNDNIKLAIIGNKIDLLPVAEQKYPQNNALIQEAIQFTNELLNAKHYITSAKLNQGIGDLFISLSRRMIEQSKRQLLTRDTRLINSRSRPSRTLALTDDDDDDDNGEEENGKNSNNAYNNNDRLRRQISSINLNSRVPNSSRAESSCQCWK